MRRRRHKLQVSTFPFLAVLLCAMGALLLVLLVMDRRAHDAARARAQQAARRAAEDAASDAESRRASAQQALDAARAARLREREAEHGRLLSQVAGVQGETMSVRDQIAEAAARLRAEQSQENALKQKIDAEQKKADTEQQAILQVRGEEAKNAAQSEASHKELAAMTADLAQLERALADLKAAREKDQKTYSVVPYNGKHGENRRPLYVECAGDQLIFHPERLSLPESRIATDGEAEVQRRLARQKEQLPPAQASAFVPYLMLLVRPDGVVSYYRLREALHALKIDFGYEFIDADWALDFPADDAAPAAPWMTAAKPPDVAPPTAPPGTPLAGVKPGFGPVASAGGPSSPGPGGQSPGAPGRIGGDEPPAVAPSPGPGGAARPGGPATHGSVGEHMGSQFGSLKSDANGPAAGPVLAEAGTPGAGAASEPGRQGSPVVGAPLPPVPGPPGIAPGSAAGAPGTTKALPGARNGGAVAPPASGPPGIAAGGAASGSGTTNAASGTVQNGAATGPPPVPGPPRDGAAASTETPPWAPKAGASGTPPTAGPKDGATPAPASAGSATAKAPPPNPHEAAASGAEEDEPFLRSPPPPLPNTRRTAPALRPARLSGDRDWIIYVECKPEGVVVYPTQLLVPASALARPSGSNPLVQSIQQLIDRKQASVRTGDQPYRPEVRFLVHGDAGRTYHMAYPMLDGVAAPKTAQILTPDDDVSAIVTGH